MPAWLAWLESAALSRAMREQVWLYPAVEIVHIVGFSVLVGAVTLFDLRLLGCAATLPVRMLARHLLLWALASLLLIVPAGAAMFAAQPAEFAGNGVFLLKLGLILVAGANAAIFHLGVYRSVEQWNIDTSTPAIARLQALLSISLWIGIISCGRLLAYT
ncbi:DUF6644 family protein [Pseudomonas sp. JDS28PS106]|uniref:DUF6644 family protein n=1 Tax=Pseudomonas sp. JDS28PS106 TaxID=2497235 RepID=UPI002FD1CD96